MKNNNEIKLNENGHNQGTYILLLYYVCLYIHWQEASYLEYNTILRSLHFSYIFILIVQIYFGSIKKLFELHCTKICMASTLGYIFLQC